MSVELGQVWFELLYSWGHFDELEQATLQMMADEPTSPEESRDRFTLCGL